MTVGPALFGRKWKVTLGTLAIDSLRVAFRIEKTLAPQPNKAEIKVWNLSAAHIQALENLAAGKVPIPVQVEAGYQAATSVLFVGELRHVETERQGADLITTVGSGDGEKAYQTSRINVSIRPNTTTDQALKMIAASLGVSKGNLSAASVKLRLAGVGNLFSHGTVFCGSASREMTNICRSCGLTWSIQNGELQLLPLGKALDASAIDLSPETGLVGSPTLDVKGKLSVRMLMIPDMFPGRKLVLTSDRLSGNYRAETTVHTGDSHGQEWYVDAEGKAL